MLTAVLLRQIQSFFWFQFLSKVAVFSFYNQAHTGAENCKLYITNKLATLDKICL